MAGGASQISGLHLAIAAGGGVLLYAALRGVSPLDALRDIADGSPPAVSTEGTRIESSDGTAEVPGGYGSETWNGVYARQKVPTALQRPTALIAAAQTHRAEQYSQAKRWARGYSDCASFVGKALLDIGVTPPGNSVTGDYLSSGSWTQVSSPRAGDVAVNAQHMVLCTSGSAGIGQQNPARDVQSDTIDNLMANTGSFKIMRLKRWA